MAVLLVGAGCGKKGEAAGNTEEAVVTAPPTNPKPPAEPTEPKPAGPTQDYTAVLQELTQVVRRYGAEQRQRPQSLNDLVAKGYLKAVPPAPPGQKFAINKQMEVYLTE